MGTTRAARRGVAGGLAAHSVAKGHEVEVHDVKDAGSAERDIDLQATGTFSEAVELRRRGSARRVGSQRGVDRGLAHESLGPTLPVAAAMHIGHRHSEKN